MWKYIDKNQCNEFLLSLNLIDGKTNNEIIKKLYSISNKVDSSYKVYYIKKEMVNIELYMNLIKF